MWRKKDKRLVSYTSRTSGRPLFARAKSGNQTLTSSHVRGRISPNFSTVGLALMILTLNVRVEVSAQWLARFSSYTGKCRDSTWRETTNASFHILFNSLVINYLIIRRCIGLVCATSSVINKLQIQANISRVGKLLKDPEKCGEFSSQQNAEGRVWTLDSGRISYVGKIWLCTRSLIICTWLFTNIFRVYKSRRLRWGGHVAYNGEVRNSYKMLV
jgi:hypothetical protein